MNQIRRLLERLLANEKTEDVSAGPAMATKPGVIFLAAGVILPALVIVLELTTRICAQEFFDPMPTIRHILLVSFVPLSNLGIWLALRRNYTSRPRLLGILNGAAMGVALYYTVLFVPLMPLALIALVWVIGILPMAPLFSFIYSVVGFTRLRRVSRSVGWKGVPGTLIGIAIALVAIVAADLPATITRVAMKMAVSETPETRLKAIRWLRSIGDSDIMLRMCYQRPKLASDLLSLAVTMGDPVQPQKAREVYYRVTGDPYDTVPPPAALAQGVRFPDQYAFDRDQGGSTVGRRLNGLSLDGSRLDGSIDPDAALAYVEWTMEFKNETPRRQEARAQIALPPGGVVSRLTLWIDGEEREAAFAARRKVREAYQRVVRKQRDPVLVTTCGPDRILMQCFPVEPRGGRMKVRIGITAPLSLQDKDRGVLRLPHITERNFGVPTEVRHLVWMESKNELHSRGEQLVPEQAGPALHALRGDLSENDLTNEPALIEAHRSKDVSESWAEDLVSKDGHVVVQTLEEKAANTPDLVVLVLDGSKSMMAASEGISNAMKSLPADMDFAVLLASDGVVEVAKPSKMSSEQLRNQLSETLGKILYAGGQDNLPALARAWDLASQSRNALVVWIHGPQPVLLESVERVKQKWERRPGNVRILDVEAIPGPNRIIEELDGMPFLERLPRIGELQTDLERLFHRLQKGSAEPTMERRRVLQTDVPDLPTTGKTSGHLVRLWAYGEVMKLCASKDKGAHDEAVRLAAAYSLVTPRSGAVVLETAQQFQQAGLTPAPPGQVPTIPEPETWALIGVLFVVFLITAWKKRSANPRYLYADSI